LSFIVPTAAANLCATLAGQMVLLHGFIKKSQKTPAIDLKTAKDRLKKLKATS